MDLKGKIYLIQYASEYGNVANMEIEQQITLHCLLNPIALRTAKTLWSFSVLSAVELIVYLLALK